MLISQRRVAGLAAGLVWLMCLARPAAAVSLLDPRLHFRTLITPHFRIYFHQGEERLAARLAEIAEDTWPRLGQAFEITAPRLTHVILGDQSELANGWATPIPYDTIFITAAAPSGVEFIGQNDDWLRLVFTHEFTHIVHLDRSEGWARFFRGVFGRTPIAFPNLALPPWMIEGIAQWEESAVTGTGRRFAGDFRAVEREAGRAHRVEPLDRLNGALTDWPGGNGPYAFGLGFHEFLAERYSAQRFAVLAEVTARTAPFAGATAFDRVFGRTLNDLWAEYTATLAQQPAPYDPGEPTPLQLTRHGFTVVGPRFLPPTCGGCEQLIAYSTRNPHGFPALREVEAGGGRSRYVTSRYLGSAVAATDRVLLFDQQEFRRDVGLYSDLYLLDRASGDVRALTHEARILEPDLSPDGRTIVAVRQQPDRRELVTLPWDGTKVGAVRPLVSDADTHFDSPRWSPDGRSIAVTRHRIGAQAELVTIAVDSGDIRTLATFARGRVATPAWRPDGRAVVAAANVDGDTFNLYEFSAVDPAAAPKQLTHTTGGATWPDISADGKTLVFVGYTVNGFDLFTLPYPADARTIQIAMAEVEPRHDASSPAPGLPVRTAGYTPWPTLAPTTWWPLLQRDDQFRAGLALHGTDVLGRHSYSASLTWLLDGPSGAQPPDRARPDWSFTYVYDRWRPTLFASASSDTLFYGAPPSAARPDRLLTGREREIEAGAFVRVRHARRSHRAMVSMAAITEQQLFPVTAADRSRVSARLGVSTSSAHLFGYSVSPERGLTAGATTEVTRRAFGSSDDATVLTADVRGYLPGMAAHHVVALRASGGTNTNDTSIGRGFELGGAGPNAEVLDFGRGAFTLLRGFPSGSFTGRNVALLNADYRFPLARPQRGYATWPIFLHTIHGAFLADAGTVWNGGFDLSAVKTSLGGELTFDINVAHAYSLTLAFGSAWGYDRADGSHRTTWYARVGRAF